MIKKLTKSIVLFIESEKNESNIGFKFRKKCIIDEDSNWLSLLSHQLKRRISHAIRKTHA